MELTTELEKNIPSAVEVVIERSENISGDVSEGVSRITNQIFNGSYTAITNSGDGANIAVKASIGDKASFVKTLSEAGITESDAEELAEIVETEKPENAEEPWGAKAKSWLSDNISKAWDGSWKVGGSVATKVLTESAMRYYGLK